MNKLYLFHVVGGNFPAIWGPFDNEADRMKKAREIKNHHPEYDEVFKLSIDKYGCPWAGPIRDKDLE